MAPLQSISRRTRQPARKALQALSDGQRIPGIAASTSQQLTDPLQPWAPAAAIDTQRFPTIKTGSEVQRSFMGLRKANVERLTTLYRAPRDNQVITIPCFHDDITFTVYQWPDPKPRNYTKLTPSQQAWKDEADKTFAADSVDNPDLADEWDGFAGNLECYSSDQPNAREYAIASTFVNRAKRAFVAGRSWGNFEQEEKRVDSTAAVQKEPNAKRELMLQEALDNGLRLAVFEKLKDRLCVEIWSQPFPQRKWANPEVMRLLDKQRMAAQEEYERTVAYWSSVAGLSGEIHPITIFQEDFDAVAPR